MSSRHVTITDTVHGLMNTTTTNNNQKNEKIGGTSVNNFNVYFDRMRLIRHCSLPHFPVSP